MRTLFRVIWVITLLLFIPLYSCTAQYAFNLGKSTLENINLSDSHQVSRDGSWAVHSSSHIYLAPTTSSTDKDLESGYAPYPRAQTALDEGLYMSLSEKFPFAFRSTEKGDLGETLGNAKLLGAQLLIYPQIVYLENKLNTRTELSEGKYVHKNEVFGPDTTRVTFTIYDVHSESLLDVVNIESQSRFFARSEKDMHRFYRKASEQFVASISNSNR